MKKNQLFVGLLALVINLNGFIAVADFSEIRVSSYAELKEKFRDSAPGDVFLLKDGNYTGEPCILHGEGTAEKPIIIKSENLHQAKIGSEFQIKGSFITLEGVAFADEGHLIIEGTGMRMTRCLINDSKAKKWVMVLPGSMQVEMIIIILKIKLPILATKTASYCG